MKCLHHKEQGFDRISLDVIYVFGFEYIPDLSEQSIQIADPAHPELAVGDKLTANGQLSRIIYD
jgi:hypothetical protein